jgi:hypothetical protein
VRKPRLSIDGNRVRIASVRAAFTVESALGRRTGMVAELVNLPGQHGRCLPRKIHCSYRAFPAAAVPPSIATDKCGRYLANGNSRLIAVVLRGSFRLRTRPSSSPTKAAEHRPYRGGAPDSVSLENKRVVKICQTCGNSDFHRATCSSIDKLDRFRAGPIYP